MKIATFNINNVNRRLTNLLDWMAAAQPDVVCLQELKAEDSAFPIAAFEAACLEWPTHMVTLRDRARIVRKRELPPRSASASGSAVSR